MEHYYLLQHLPDSDSIEMQPFSAYPLPHTSSAPTLLRIDSANFFSVNELGPTKKKLKLSRTLITKSYLNNLVTRYLWFDLKI